MGIKRTGIRSLVVGLSLSLLLSGGCRGVAAPKPTPPDKILPPFRESTEVLSQKTRVPVVLPDRLPDKKDEPPLYGTLIMATVNEYEIVLGFTPDCGGGNACRWGTLSGQMITPNSPSIARQYADFRDPNFEPWAKLPEDVKRQFGPVKLDKGIQGFFVPSTCGANCSDSMIIWDQGSYRYSVGIKAAPMKEVLDLANSAISNQK